MNIRRRIQITDKKRTDDKVYVSEILTLAQILCTEIKPDIEIKRHRASDKCTRAKADIDLPFYFIIYQYYLCKYLHTYHLVNISCHSYDGVNVTL